ncbi:TonB-dependent siderophore receptor [Motilimonas sp. E26]|uniref:TonB-dependent siderophore receptor n=1 Tax=Motilimonas sp. E26 TaxID=2865674 RepID=UPI001E382DA7|nr:TonB-dependent siderophore receptor [Motilimonas sp. E26]MCE0558279.1 TonB-dependent siderophore receptor [Motilimonas sp. E26]
MFAKSPLSLIIAAILTPSFVLAQTTSNDDDAMVVVGQHSSYKVDTNSTSMRMETTQLETPGQVNVIDEQIIDEQRASTLGDVLENDASISAGGDSRNRERFSLRGFELSSSSSFLRDGKQHWSHYRQPIELLERIEVLKGPSGLLYGKSAPGGLVNMVSKKPTHDTLVNFSQDVGANNAFRSVLDVSGSLNQAQTLRGRTVLAKQSYDNWRRYTDGSTPSTERFVGGLFLDYDLNDKVLLSMHYDRTNDHGSVDSGAYIQDGKAVLGNKHIWDAQWSKIENDVENIGFDINAALSENWNLSVAYNHQDFERRDVESFSDAKSYDPATGQFKYRGYDRWDNWRFDTAYVDLTGQVTAMGMDHQLLVGANWLKYYYVRQIQQIKGLTGTVGQPLAKPDGLNYQNGKKSDATKTDSYGIYLQDLATINQYWQVLAGVRFDREETKTDSFSNILPKAAVILHPNVNSSIYFTYSESFEPKNPIDNPRDVNNGMELDPIKGKLLELGTKWELLDNRLYLSGALFDISQENILISQDAPNGQIETTQAGEQVHRGIEFAATGYISNALSLNASMMALDAEIKDKFDASINGNRPTDVPELSGSLWARYSFEQGTDVNLGAIYQGARYGDEQNTYKKDAYTRFDLGVSHTLNYDENLDVIMRVNVENLLDTDYLKGGGQSGTAVGEGRNLNASVMIRY